MRELDQSDPKEQMMQHLRSKATDLLLRENWTESIQAYTQLISLCQDQILNPHQNPDPDHLPKLKKSLCLALSNRAEAQLRLREFDKAMADCDAALQIESTHFKTLLCKGKILLNLNKYGMTLECFKIALLDYQASVNIETVNGYLEKCKKLEFLSRTGAFDLSDWVVNGFRGKSPELAEYIGSVEIKKSQISGRGLFATTNIDSGTLLFVTKAIAIERGILPQSQNEDSIKNSQLVMWKNFIDKVVDSSSKCQKTRYLIRLLSTGDNEDGLQVPDISQFRPESEDIRIFDDNLDMNRMLSILDVNSLVEDAISAKVLGKNSGYYGVGLWVLPSLINHSCDPNARRVHVGDHVIVHASRDIKAGEEITFAYFDVLLPLINRKEMAIGWGFICKCKRCNFEENLCSKQEMREIEVCFERGLDMGGVANKLEETMKRWMIRGKGKGYFRASFWAAYSECFKSEKLMKRWRRRIPAVEILVDSVGDAVGCDERISKVLMEELKRSSGGSAGGGGVWDMERAMKLGRGVYGKVMKKQAMRILLELVIQEQS